MDTVIVYDHNNLDSILAAACVVSAKGYKACEARAFPPAASNYIWLGCAPGDSHRINNPDIAKANHVVFLDSASAEKNQKSMLNGLNFFHSTEDHDEQSFSDRTYGRASLIERVMSYLKEDVNNFTRPILYAREFYSQKASEDFLHETALNVKEALFCLRSGSEVYTPVNIAGAEEDAYQAYSEMVTIAKSAIDHRSHRAHFITQHGESKEAFTFFEPEHWWFIRRRFWMNGKIHRNVCVTATGMLVSTSAPYFTEIPNHSPLFVY